MSKIEELQKNSHTHDRVVNAIVEDIGDLNIRHMTNSARIDNLVGWSCEHLQRLDQLDEDISVISNENAQLKKDYSNVVDAFISFAYRLDTDMMAIREEVRELKELESNHFRWCDWSIKAITDVIVKMKKKKWWQLW